MEIDATDRSVHCDTVDEFLDTLDPKRPQWHGDGLYSPWIFRGQPDSEQDLVPRVWRRDDEFVRRALAPFLDAAGEVPKRHAQTGWRLEAMIQLRAERLLLQAFRRIVDSVGLPIPHVANYADVAVGTGSSESEFWPDPRHPFTALAQHHGIPTRLLDFTRSPRAAAFFAAFAGARQGKRIAVWACRTDQLPPFVLNVSAPRSENTYLHAQSGTFLLYERAEMYFEEHQGEWPAFNRLYAKGATQRITLPSTLRVDVLRRLWLDGVSLASLMPSYASAADTLRLIHGGWTQETLWPPSPG